ncbi:hypothetical protein R3W88_004991 [Solanum pinnatisectum]|uniref:Endonuclease/exonuclease/phosphatase domain-containing protein n=1 Tax=Solanum pinnatisectum TaxID=50273 RepID=A0AAV9KBC5_9SOLN|nr:hypothetical protein R3W88_004991 [Solanum pinnatisectum]
MVKVLSENYSWLFSALYASNEFLWDSLRRISQTHSGPWFLGGDFNEVLQAKDKLGGKSINNNHTNILWHRLNKCNMIDLGFKGSKYTWTNKRYKNMKDLIMERLDRCLANDPWVVHYPDSTVTHLPRTHSNHCPLKVHLERNRPNNGIRPFRLKPMCFYPHNDLPQAIITFKDNTTIWNRNVFGNIFSKMRKIVARIDGIQKSRHYPHTPFLHDLESTLLCEYNTILKIDWLTYGDANTNFFHISTINRRRRNRILLLKDDTGNEFRNQDEIMAHATSFIIHIYSTELLTTTLPEPRNHLEANSLTNPVREALDATLTNKEIRDAINSLSPSRLLDLMASTPCSFRNTEIR